MSILSAFASLGANLNKRLKSTDEELREGVVSDLTPELELSMPDEELIDLTRDWQKRWDDSPVKTEWLEKCVDNENYWLGKHFTAPEMKKLRPLVDNAIFEALETFLPQATRRNPEPVVTLASDVEQTPENLDFAKEMQQSLADLADDLKLRLKIKRVARQWAIYLLGAAKLGWDTTRDDITVKPIRAKKLILDPEAVNDEDGYSGEFVGEPRSMKASILVRLVPKKTKFITELVKGEMGTSLSFIEWWTADYMCWTLGTEVLLKTKNPHWNYEKERVEQMVNELGETSEAKSMAKGLNHFPAPKIPYVFLSIFNLGKQPVDDTSLISQNLANQDLINKRLKQIDKNADSMNGGIVVSEERSGLTKEQAAGVTEALRKGGTVVIPNGSPREAVDHFVAPALPSDVYNQLADTRQRLMDTFGTRGSTPAGIGKEATVRGKIIVRGLDTDRIGGGVTEYLEQFADDVYNWFVQLMYVYHDEFQGLEADKIPKIIVSVKEGSLLPKDTTTLANQAIDLAAAGFLSPIDLYEKLEFPDPKETAKNLWLWTNAPHILFKGDPDVMEALGIVPPPEMMQEQIPPEMPGNMPMAPDLSQSPDVLSQVPVE